MSDRSTKNTKPNEDDILRQRHLEQIAAIIAADWPPTEIARRLRQEVVGQEEAVATLAGVLHRHLLTLRLDRESSPQAPPPCKQPVLLIGDSGTGKTKLVTELSRLTSLPAVIADTSQLTEAGFTGNSVDDYAAELIEKSNMNLWLGAHGLVYADELDKCRIQPTNTRDVSGAGSQDSLLKLCDASGEIYCHGVSNGPMGARRYQGPFEVGRLMIVAGGAFQNGLHEIIARRLGERRTIGFGSGQARTPDDSQRRADLLEAVTGEDLVEYGMKIELIARLATVCVLRPLTRDQMLQVLAVVPSGPVQTAVQVASTVGFDLHFAHPLLVAIVDEAMRAGLGARALFGITHRVCQRVMFEVPEQISGTRTQRAVVTLDLDALRDGSYKLEWQRRPTKARSRRLAAEDDTAGDDGEAAAGIAGS